MTDFKQTREVIKYALKYISGKTLDLGAGSAKYRSIIEKKSSEYITFDMVEGDGIDVVGDVLNLSFKKESFDTVISTQVLEHVEQPWIMIDEIYRILKKDGICILTAPFLQPYHADPNDYFRYTIEGINSLFKNQGFKIIESGSCGRSFVVLSEFIRFLYFNPYKKARRGSWRITRLMTEMARILNKFSRNKIIYANVYIIAKK